MAFQEKGGQPPIGRVVVPLQLPVGKTLTEHVNYLSKEEERRILRRGSQGSTCGFANLIRCEMKPFDHKSRVVKVKLRSPSQLGNYTVERSHQPYTEIAVMHQIGGAITISRRHRDDRPAGKICR